MGSGVCVADVEGRPRRMGAIASRTFSRAWTPAFLDGDAPEEGRNETRLSRGFAVGAPGESGLGAGIVYVKRDFVPRSRCTCARISKIEGRCVPCSRSIDAEKDVGMSYSDWRHLHSPISAFICVEYAGYGGVRYCTLRMANGPCSSNGVV